jgi:hypothetical protein
MLYNHLGGEDYVPETKRLTCRRVACLESELVHLETKIAAARAEGNEPSVADLELYSRLSNSQRRHLDVLGWERTQKDITTLGSILREGCAA